MNEKPVVVQEAKFEGIYATSQISNKNGSQFVTLLCGSKQIKLRNLYPDPNISRLLPGSMVTMTAREIEFIMSDFNGMFFGSRSLSASPIAVASQVGGPALDKKTA